MGASKDGTGCGCALRGWAPEASGPGIQTLKALQARSYRPRSGCDTSSRIPFETPPLHLMMTRNLLVAEAKESRGILVPGVHQVHTEPRVPDRDLLHGQGAVKRGPVTVDP
jgi:hypothetical protein